MGKLEIAAITLSLLGVYSMVPTTQVNTEIQENESWLRQMTSCNQVYSQGLKSLKTSAYFKPPFAPSPFDSDGNKLSCEGLPDEP